MKKILLVLLAVASLATVAVSPVAFVGCAEGIHVASVEPGNDTVVVRAEQAYQLAFDTLDALYQSDLDNRAIILKYAPEVHAQINALKPRSKKALANVKNILATYKSNRSEDNKATLSTYLATLSAILKEAQTYQTDITDAVAKG